jgi:uncharacterized damage-inducible protein DinB
MELELFRTLISYHVDMTRHVLNSINHLSEEQFLADDSYSRGSIRNLMVHLASTDRRWLAGLNNLPDVGHLKFEDFQTKKGTQEAFEQILKDLAEYSNALSNDELMQSANNIPNPRWAVLLHLINHGTDHRATVLQKLTEYGAPTFDQDFILWLWSSKHEAV